MQNEGCRPCPGESGTEASILAPHREEGCCLCPGKSGTEASVRVPRREEGCRLCPRECGALRREGQPGVCRETAEVRVARAALHFWEEPCISGEKGSGAVFFTGCALHCVYCQNEKISRGLFGKKVTIPQLAAIFLSLQEQGAQNINLVTAGHFLLQVREALLLAKSEGLLIPVVYNSSSYEKAEMLRLLSGLVDIYLPDLKYLDETLARQYSGAPDYPAAAKAALREMVRQCPEPVFDGQGMMQKGVIVRHLLLPGHVREAKRVAAWLHEEYGNHIYISLMSQYTPGPAVRDDPLLGRRVTRREYERLLAFATAIGIEQGFYQEGGTAAESFIPEFDGTGVDG